MGSSDFVDPYLVPGTDLLRNLVGASSNEELAAAEADLTFARALQLLDSPVSPTNDLDELRRIHFHLFQDVFDWAGQLRTVDVRKNVPGAEYFMPVTHIEHAAAICFQELGKASNLQGLPRDKFVHALAYHYEKINYIHPFREGNGRTQRFFWNRVAYQAGWYLDWRPVHGEENHSAARAGSDDIDLGPLVRMFDKIVIPAKAMAYTVDDEISRLSIKPPESL